MHRRHIMSSDPPREEDVPAPFRGSPWDRLRRWAYAHKVLATLLAILLALVLAEAPRQLAHADTGGSTPADTATSGSTDPLVDQNDYMATDPLIGSFTGDQKQCLPSGDPDTVCLWSTPTEVSKARSGYFDKKSGFDPSVVFAAPKKTKDLFAGKIANRIDSSNRNAIYGRYDPARTCNNDQCLAYKMYGSIVMDASCVTKGVPTNLAHTCARTPDSAITYAGVVNGISLAVCGAGVAIAVIAKAPAIVAGGMGGACVWDAWKSWVFK